MKYQVQIKYTNPSHEHVSLRRRVDTITRLVEASNEDEALNRAANQQRALGFRIQSANIVEQKVEEPKAEMIAEAKGTAGYPLLKKGEKLKPMKLKEEEVELDEASKEGKDVMRNMRASLKSMDLRHGVDSDKRVSGYKMSPAVKAAQAKSDMLSKKVKRPQAGTLAAVHKSMEREMMKKEAVDPGSVKVVNKKVKAAEKMINAAKGKVNKVDLKPTLDLEKHKD